MKLNFIAVFGLLTLSLSSLAQGQYEVTKDNDGGKILKGIISRDLLEKDSSFKWYPESLKGWAPNRPAVEAFKKQGDSLQLIVFMGTWCEDSHFVVPKLFTLLDAASFSRDRISLLGVDRNKKTLSHLTDALNIVNVPTIIVMKNGKEMGRVVEYGKSGLFDKDLGEIVAGIGNR